MSPHSRLAATYFLIQAMTCSVWWVMLFAIPSSCEYFIPSTFHPDVLISLILADVALVACGSLWASICLFSHKDQSRPVCWLVTGAVAYATLMCVGWILFTGEPVLPAILMTAALAGTIWATLAAGDLVLSAIDARN